jgi:ADP-heptose:LPS heptosyltransferase
MTGRLGVRVVTALRALASVAGPRRAPGEPVRRILVAHYLLLGDTILLAPLLKALAARYPDAERLVLARPAVAPLFDGRPYGATVMAFDRRDAASRRRVIDSGPYDLAIVPDDNRYAWLARAAGARRVVGFANDRPAWKNWMLDRAVQYPDAPGAWADMAAAGLGDVAPQRFRPLEWTAPPAADFALPTPAYAVLHVGASTPLKQWPAPRWRALADRLRADGLRVVWSGGAGERRILDEIAVGVDETDLLGALDLPQLWRLLAGARILVCPDTGIAHLARVVGVPTVALFGPGSSVVHGAGTFWADAAFRAVTVEGFPCRDQHTLYRRDVPWVRRCGRRFDAAAAPAGASDPGACGRALCMEAIDVAMVAVAVDASLR